MENELIKLLDSEIECLDTKIVGEKIILSINSLKNQTKCPYYGAESSQIHSTYQREMGDISMHDKQTILLLKVRKFFCKNQECSHKTFSERFNFVAPNQKKTNRLLQKILFTSTKLSSVTESSLLKANAIKVSKSSICDLLKKNANYCG
jgi:transposase